MRYLKITAVTALALVTMFAGQAAAQTVPVLAVSAGAPTGIGATVTIQWSTLPGAQGYTLEAGTVPGVANIATVNLPPTLTRIVVFAPNGTYHLRVRGFAGAIVGDFSPVQTVTVGGPVTCPTLVAPTVTASNSSYLSVKVDWTPSPGATGYMVEYSRNNSSTELAEAASATTNSVTKYAGMIGNFFVRVVAHNACNQVAASAYMPFTITNTPGTGPRTPDPPPGQLIPRASLGYLRETVLQVAAAYPHVLANSCGSRAHNFLNLLVRELRKRDSRWGLNYKRGWAGSLSHDVVAYNPTSGPDNGASQIYLYDVIFRHDTFCEGIWGAPMPAWDDITDATWAGRGSSACGTEWCARWTIDSYLRAGFPPDERQ